MHEKVQKNAMERRKEKKKAREKRKDKTTQPVCFCFVFFVLFFFFLLATLYKLTICVAFLTNQEFSVLIFNTSCRCVFSLIADGVSRIPKMYHKTVSCIA